METRDIIDYLQSYDGPALRLMEVCGTHTAAIFKHGIRDLLSPKISLLAGPGCPVCVTPSAYIDRCIDYAKRDNHVLLSFGDMLKVPGSQGSLSDAKGDGAAVELIYSPLVAVDRAANHSQITYVVASVGFETTAPAYSLLLTEAIARGLTNLKLLTALKLALPALAWLCQHEPSIDGFLCPGHVSVITGSSAYQTLADTYGKPCVVAGFEAEHLLAAIYALVRQVETGSATVQNLYQNAVRAGGNPQARAEIDRYFTTGDAVWRGLGSIGGSGLYLRPEYASFDVGSDNLTKDQPLLPACRCAEVITGRLTPTDCPLFDRGCTPLQPHGPCMVSAEGACGIWYRYGRGKQQ